MEDNTNNTQPAPLPELPSEEDARKERMEAISAYLLDARENYPEPFYLLEYNGVPFSTLGGIQALSGQKKNGKTFVLAQLMAAVLNGSKQSRAKTYLSGLMVPERTLDHLGHEPSVLYVDTEMEKLNSAKVLRRVHWLCGWPMDVPNERFHVLWLRSVTKDDKEAAHQKRYRLIKLAIEILHPDAVFIDGIRDIVGDFNDNAEASSLVGDLMALAEARGICIWNTLHMNPRPKNDDESKMRGHLGTELGNKITDTLVSIKHKEHGDVWFTVKQDDARGKDMDDWEFVVTEDAGALGVPKMRHVATHEERDEAEYQRKVIEADDYLKQFNWTSGGATYTEIFNWLYKMGITSKQKRDDIRNIAMDAGIIYKTDKRKYHYAGLNKQAPDDSIKDLPFGKPDGEDAPY